RPEVRRRELAVAKELGDRDREPHARIVSRGPPTVAEGPPDDPQTAKMTLFAVCGSPGSRATGPLAITVIVVPCHPGFRMTRRVLACKVKFQDPKRGGAPVGDPGRSAVRASRANCERDTAHARSIVRQWLGRAALRRW